jgi:hypothetical protein
MALKKKKFKHAHKIIRELADGPKHTTDLVTALFPDGTKKVKNIYRPLKILEKEGYITQEKDNKYIRNGIEQRGSKPSLVTLTDKIYTIPGYKIKTGDEKLIKYGLKHSENFTIMLKDQKIIEDLINLTGLMEQTSNVCFPVIFDMYNKSLEQNDVSPEIIELTKNQCDDKIEEFFKQWNSHPIALFIAFSIHSDIYSGVAKDENRVLEGLAELTTKIFGIV